MAPKAITINRAADLTAIDPIRDLSNMRNIDESLVKDKLLLRAKQASDPAIVSAFNQIQKAIVNKREMMRKLLVAGFVEKVYDKDGEQYKTINAPEHQLVLQGLSFYNDTLRSEMSSGVRAKLDQIEADDANLLQNVVKSLLGQPSEFGGDYES